MHADLWIVGVIRDIQKFARRRGHHRLTALMDQAVEEFMKDVRDMNGPQLRGLAIDGHEFPRRPGAKHTKHSH